MHPFSTPLKHQETSRFSNVSWVKERVHWERMDQMIIKEVTFFKKKETKGARNLSVEQIDFFFSKKRAFALQIN